MAESLDDGEFWLPPQFLTDDDILMDMSKSNNKKDAFDSEAEATKPLFPFEFSYGFGSFGHSSSDLSSPVESVMGSTETESDEEDFIAGLTRQMAHSTLEEDFAGNHKTKGRFVSGSPQSTLCAVGSGCGCRQGSSRGSPNCQSRVSSPPGTWDLLYAAAGEVERIRMNQESYGCYNHNRGLLGPPRKPSPVSVPVKNHANLFDVGFYNAQHQHQHQHHHQQSLSHQKLQASQFQHLKQQQMMKQQQGSSVWVGPQSQAKATTGLYQVGLTRVQSRNTTRPLGLSPSAWPPLQQAQQQQQNGSGMRAVFLGAPSGKKECAGTGVFLPRRVNTPTETRKKPGTGKIHYQITCSTVLLPAKVVQALNLNFDEMGAPFQPRFGSYAPDTDATLGYRNGYQKRNLRQQQGMNHEIRLPQEWTY
ncbi:hypothetical protein Pint_35292 [Pistacia integerrima]|uniref:Uncharacterized protein n=1 Tax=Pistacia integerrima TaxID=434235 RepID=A0ACC0XZE9_9ROSI|nr:hypothetical protein Pint_35292 [Pistacia integerrima]